MKRRTAEFLTGLSAAGLAAVVAAAGATSTSSQIERPKPAATYAAEPGAQLPTSPIPAFLRPAAQAVLRVYELSQQPGSGIRVSREDAVFAEPTEDMTFKTASGDTVDVYFASKYKRPTDASQIDGLGVSVEAPGRVSDQPDSSSVIFYDMGDMWGGDGGYLTLEPGSSGGVMEHYSALRTFGPDRACYGLRVKREGVGELKAHCTQQDLGAMALIDNLALARQVASVAADRPGETATLPQLPRPASPQFPFEPIFAGLAPAA